jgi:hypothetical protein
VLPAPALPASRARVYIEPMITRISDAILHALAPGIALNSAIFYNSSLQGRFLYITARARDLNKEAREYVRAGHDDPLRMSSLRMQVMALTGRAHQIRRAILVVYCSLCCFILTILALLGGAVSPVPGNDVLALIVFGLGFILMGCSTLLSLREMAMSQRTLDEDIRSSFPLETSVTPGGE